MLSISGPENSTRTESAPRCRQQAAAQLCHPVSGKAPTTAGKVLEPTAVDCGGRCARLFRFLPDQVQRTGCTCLLNLPAATTAPTPLPVSLYHTQGAATTVPESESSGRSHSGSHLIDRRRRAPRTAPGSTQAEGENPALRGRLGKEAPVAYRSPDHCPFVQKNRHVLIVVECHFLGARVERKAQVDGVLPFDDPSTDEDGYLSTGNHQVIVSTI